MSNRHPRVLAHAVQFTVTRNLLRPASVAWLIAIISVSIATAQTDGGDGQSSHLYFFTNDGCAPCRQVEPAIEELHAQGYPVTTIKLCDRPDWGQQFQVDRTPTVILVTGNRITGRHAGLIDLPTLQQWFAAVGQGPETDTPVRTGQKSVVENRAISGQAVGTKVSLGQPQPCSSAGFASPTMHKGTTVAANPAEKRALDATVRLKVEDPEGISYATGTVIHSHGGESLVLTCGHVFRDAGGKGVITAEFGFADGRVIAAPGQLVSYDAEARDIGLVTIQTEQNIRPVVIAAESAPVGRDDRTFSLGCDHGDAPTIRHTAIKNRAAYDGAVKYDIYGRPVDGRSGGGLFNQNGELIGVCNAAAVEVDEGIYSAIDTIYWQLAEVNLKHLFDGSAQVADGSAGSQPSGDRFASADFGRESFAESLTNQRRELRSGSDGAHSLARIRPGSSVTGSSQTTRPGYTPVRFDAHAGAVAQQAESDKEVVILIRSKSDPTHVEAISIADPGEELLEYLGEMHADQSRSRHLNVAQLRKRIEYSGR